MYEITLWQIFVILILFVVLLRWVNELAKERHGTHERDVKCIQKGLRGRTWCGWYSRVTRSMEKKVSTVGAWYHV